MLGSLLPGTIAASTPVTPIAPHPPPPPCAKCICFGRDAIYDEECLKVAPTDCGGQVSCTLGDPSVARCFSKSSVDPGVEEKCETFSSTQECIAQVGCIWRAPAEKLAWFAAIRQGTRELNHPQPSLPGTFTLDDIYPGRIHMKGWLQAARARQHLIGTVALVEGADEQVAITRRSLQSLSSNLTPNFMQGTWRFTTFHDCDNSCSHASDGDCDDGGPGAEFSSCRNYDDCDDCGISDLDNDLASFNCAMQMRTHSCSSAPVIEAVTLSAAAPGCSYHGITQSELTVAVQIANDAHYSEELLSCSGITSVGISAVFRSSTSVDAPSGQKYIICSYYSRSSSASALLLLEVEWLRAIDEDVSSFICPASESIATSSASATRMSTAVLQCSSPPCGTMTCGCEPSPSPPTSASSSVGLIAGVGGGVVAIVGIGAAVYLMKMRATKVAQSPQAAVYVVPAVELAPVEATQVTQRRDQSGYPSLGA